MSTCTRSFPCRPESVREVRRWITQCLPDDCPAADDLVIVTSELVTNSVCHAVRGAPVAVRLVIAAGTWVRVEVRDGGPARAGAHRAPDRLQETGRGLVIVGRLASLYRDGRGLACARLPWFPAAGGGTSSHDSPGPSWEERWLEVMTRAGWACQCTGQCGRSHRCPAEELPGRPLHVVPDRPVPLPVAARLPADQLIALCGECRAGADRRAASATPAAPAPDALFGEGVTR